MSNAIDYLVSSCGNFMWEIKTTDFVAKSDTGYFIDTSSGSVSATLPSTASIGDQIYFVDSTGSFSDADKVVILNNGHNIMGKFDVMEITEKYMSIYLVYADTTKGWVIADGKGCDEDPNGGEITVDTTIFLAPSASAYSPTGIIGSDVTGDGSIDAPFYSIKRAAEYLENYRIKVGTYVTIRGLPGKYQYNDSHSIKINHKDTKYIKIQFDTFNTGYYHETTMTDDAISVSNQTDYDLITFTVNDIGTGFYQIQAGDYIKILTDSPLKTAYYNATWNGYFEVESVDTANNKVTIKYPTHRLSNKNYYIIPSTKNSSYNIYIYKLSTHVYTSHTSGYLIYSEYGLGSIQINASSINNVNLLYIYDGVINDVIINANNFEYALKAYNLTIKFIISAYENRMSSFTACHIGMDITDGVINGNGICSMLCYHGIHLTKSVFEHWISYGFRMSITNCIIGIYLDSSSFEYNKDTSKSYMVCIYGCYDGVYLMNNSLWYSCSNIFNYNYVGFSSSHSESKFYGGAFDDNTYSTLFQNNSSDGIRLSNNSKLHYIYTLCRYNGNNGISCDNSVITCNISSWNNGYFSIRDNNGSGIYAIKDSYIQLTNTYIYNNSNYGVYMEHSKFECYTSHILNNDYYGIRLNYESNGFLYNVNIQNNSYGINVYNDSNIYMINTDGSTYILDNNTNYEVYALDNSTATIRLQNTLSTTNDFFPAANTAPTYDYQSYTRAGAYILYRDES